MTASRPDNEGIFHAVRAIPDADRRRAYVREASDGDEARVALIEALLSAAEAPDSLADRPAGGAPAGERGRRQPERAREPSRSRFARVRHRRCKTITRRDGRSRVIGRHQAAARPAFCVSAWLVSTAARGASRAPANGPSPRRLSFQFACPKAHAGGAEPSFLDRVRGRGAGSGRRTVVGRELVDMSRRKVATPSAAWIAKAVGSGVPVLSRFAVGLQADEAAVAAALTTSWSNGQVEVEVNRLKAVKWSMSGGQA